jgi:hypothetical protein
MIQPNYVDDSFSLSPSDCSLITTGRYTKAMSFAVELHRFGYLVAIQRPPRILFFI